VEVAPGVFADVILKSDGDFGTLQLTVVVGTTISGETCFVMDSKRESSRVLAGFLPVSDRLKLFYTLASSAGYTEQERAYRLTVKEPKTNKNLVDVVFSEKHIVDY
jgi:hypothetical protein